jgi:2-keto-4-pentenoate hydratase/2-oxohepta-3-ene-1,7-dioic acid hydratase in catechol pathway
MRRDQIVDLSVWLSLDITFPWLDMVDLITMGGEGMARVRAALDASDSELRAIGGLLPFGSHRQKLLAPILRPRKNVLCMGRNYAEHAAESSRAFGQAPSDTPEYPAIFTKAPTTVIGPFDDIPYDARISEQMDWEVELAVIIGRAGKNIKRDEALSYIFGYTVLNDVTARDVQKRHGGQFFKGKSMDGSCPMGPWIVTADEIGNPNDLELWARVNGQVKQHDNTSSMIWDVAGIIEQMSFGMTLEPGDIIATGTPAGVGFARTPPEFLRPGDIVECEISKIGIISNRVHDVMRNT